jgi:beta-lactamase class A
MSFVTRRPFLVLVALSSCLAGAVGCGSSSGDVDARAADADAPDAAAAADARTSDAAAGDAGGDAGGVAIPDSPAGAQLAWLLALLDGPAAAITPTAVAPHFSAAFLGQVSADDLAGTLASIAASDAPFTLQAIETATSGSATAPSALSAVVTTARQLVFRVQLAAAPPGTGPDAAKIIGLLFSPAPELDPTLSDPSVLDARLATVAAEARLLIARVQGGSCDPVHALGADQPMPLGSLFKIYVLGALAADIDAGRTQWTDQVTVQDAFKSLPSGMLQDQPAGTMVSVQDVASAMISISDNTAADHLLHLVGRERVESYQATMGHSNPALNQPFLTTRELFILKLSATADQRAAFIAADAATRRDLLASDYDQRPLPDLVTAAAWTAPIDIDHLEWFASPADICRAFAALETASEKPTGAPVASILAINPGVTVDPATFSYVGYKGGSEPGVLTLSWLLRRAADGAWVTVTLGFADPNDPIDETVAVYYAQAAIQEAGR